MSVQNMLAKLVSTDQDFEWYPTTEEIINTIKSDIKASDTFRHDNPSVLDCGAGDGRVLKALSEHGKKYAIEKSKPLLNALDKDIFVVGTEFEAQTLIDKKVDVIFSNPPYSMFEFWAEKIIKEANSGYAYLVIPNRWIDSDLIEKALKQREAETQVLGEFDFLSADRKARTKVNIVKVIFCRQGRYGGTSPKTNPFKVWFEENFKLSINKTESSLYQVKREAEEKLEQEVTKELVQGADLVAMLEELYQRDLAKLIKNYQALGDINPDILAELDVNITAVREALELKITGLKDIYWNELFNKLDRVTDRLTFNSRKALLSTLTAHTHVDFTVSNAHAIIIWIIKNCNQYFDGQLINAVERMTRQANIVLYKSNQRTFRDEDWRYCRKPEKLNNYQLDYRVVLHSMGGLKLNWYDGHVEGLSEEATNFLNDLCTIAGNLGFDTKGGSRVNSFEWESNKQNEFLYWDAKEGEYKTLFAVRAFKNGNLHIKFNKKFIVRLNIEFGRLKGWLKNKEQAAQETGYTMEDVIKGFGANLKLEKSNVLSLEFNQAA